MYRCTVADHPEGGGESHEPITGQTHTSAGRQTHPQQVSENSYTHIKNQEYQPEKILKSNITVNFLQVLKMSDTHCNELPSPKSPMEVGILDETDEDDITQEQRVEEMENKQDKRPEGPRKADLGKT